MMMWIALVPFIISIIGASMGNTSPHMDRNCVTNSTNLPGYTDRWAKEAGYYLGREGWRCSSVNPMYNVRRCIPVNWLCDGSTHYGCWDGEDEGEVCGGYEEWAYDRTCTNPVTGRSDMWRCRSGSELCIPKSYICDGAPDCEDGEDEDCR